jgi:hypothetical protein
MENKRRLFSKVYHKQMYRNQLISKSSKFAILKKRKMSCAMSFQERAKLGMEQLSKQQPVSLKEAREQVKWLKAKSTERNRKKKT